MSHERANGDLDWLYEAYGRPPAEPDDDEDDEESEDEKSTAPKKKISFVERGKLALYNRKEKATSRPGEVYLKEMERALNQDGVMMRVADQDGAGLIFPLLPDTIAMQEFIDNGKPTDKKTNVTRAKQPSGRYVYTVGDRARIYDWENAPSDEMTDWREQIVGDPLLSTISLYGSEYFRGAEPTDQELLAVGVQEFRNRLRLPFLELKRLAKDFERDYRNYQEASAADNKKVELGPGIELTLAKTIEYINRDLDGYTDKRGGVHRSVTAILRDAFAAIWRYLPGEDEELLSIYQDLQKSFPENADEIAAAVKNALKYLKLWHDGAADKFTKVYLEKDQSERIKAYKEALELEDDNGSTELLESLDEQVASAWNHLSAHFPAGYNREEKFNEYTNWLSARAKSEAVLDDEGIATLFERISEAFSKASLRDKNAMVAAGLLPDEAMDWTPDSEGEFNVTEFLSEKGPDFISAIRAAINAEQFGFTREEFEDDGLIDILQSLNVTEISAASTDLKAQHAALFASLPEDDKEAILGELEDDFAQMYENIEKLVQKVVDEDDEPTPNEVADTASVLNRLWDQELQNSTNRAQDAIKEPTAQEQAVG